MDRFVGTQNNIIALSVTPADGLVTMHGNCSSSPVKLYRQPVIHLVQTRVYIMIRWARGTINMIKYKLS